MVGMVDRRVLTRNWYQLLKSSLPSLLRNTKENNLGRGEERKMQRQDIKQGYIGAKKILPNKGERQPLVSGGMRGLETISRGLLISMT